MSLQISLPPGLERFVRESVANGDYSDVDEVVNSAVRMLQQQERRKAAFMATLIEAEAEADRDGTFSVEEVMAEIDEIIAEAECRQPA